MFRSRASIGMCECVCVWTRLTVLLSRCFSCIWVVISGDDNLAALSANWAKPLWCTSGIRKLSTRVSPRAGGLCWSATYWNIVVPNPACPKLAFPIALAKLVQGKKWQYKWNPIFGKQDSISVSASNFTDYSSLSMRMRVRSPFPKEE